MKTIPLNSYPARPPFLKHHAIVKEKHFINNAIFSNIFLPIWPDGQMVDLLRILFKFLSGKVYQDIFKVMIFSKK
jgi:hypothetical protein